MANAAEGEVPSLATAGPALAVDRRFTSIVSAIPMGIHMYRLEPDGRLVFLGANPAADRILGVTNQQFVGLTIEEAFPPLAATEIPERYRAAARDGAQWQTESLQYDEGRISGAFDVWAFQTAPGEMAALFVDITARKQTEADLQAYREQLEELVEERTRDLRRAQDELVSAERLATLGRLTATVGHELRSPLSTLRAALFSIAVAVERGGGVPLDRVREVAERAIARCDRIVDELLDYARRTEPRREATDLDAWLAEVLDDLGCPSGVEQVRRLASGARVECDRDRLRRAVANVVSNAVQAMAEVGGAAHRLTVAAAVVDGGAEIRITDTGPGIPPESLARIFEPLFSTKSFGVGLGLPIVKQIVEQHGGAVHVASQPGAGTTVILRLPVQRPGGGA